MNDNMDVKYKLQRWVRMEGTGVDGDDVQYCARILDMSESWNDECVQLVLNIPDELKKPGVLVEYFKVNGRIQVDPEGKVFAYDGPCRRLIIPLVGERYATQAEFDKFCFENPDPRFRVDNPDTRFRFDWNAEVYRVFNKYIKNSGKICEMKEGCRCNQCKWM